jgi:3-methyladenine DNA glycosylase AlkD
VLLDVASVTQVVADLKRRASKKHRDGMARYDIPSTHALGVPVGTLRDYAKTVGRDRTLALDLWKTGIYEARMLAAFVDEPERVTVAQMNAWCRDFDNWAICDHLCFILFDRSPLAWGRLAPWSSARGEFQKRAAFALLASLALHDRVTDDARFEAQLPRIRAAANDERNFVKKGVLWALRGIGTRNPSLHGQALALADELAASDTSSARWIGREATRELKKRPPRKAR